MNNSSKEMEPQGQLPENSAPLHTKRESNGLRRCPFCGDKHVTVSEYDTKDYWWAQCDNIYCGAEGPVRKSAQEAERAWNRRAKAV